jgi:glycosyltransferase involved in cell wall biosynthesis
MTRGLDVGSWADAWARGLRPDRFPYGLDRLEGGDVSLSVRAPVTSTIVDRALGGPFRRLTGGLELAEAFLGRGPRRAADVVLAWDERTGIPASLRSTLPRQPPVITGVIWLTEPDAVAHVGTRWLARRGLGRAHAVFSLSPAQHEVLEDSFGVPAERLHFIPFGVDTDFWAAPEVMSAPAHQRVLSAGNDRHRDHELLVRAFDRVVDACPTAELVVVTERDLVPSRAPVVHHQALDHVAMRRQYAGSTVVAVAVRPNLHVSGITVILEAMARGLPVVTTRTAGIEAYLDDGRTAVLVPPGNEGAMADALVDLLRDPAAATALGENGRRHVLEHHSTETMAAALRGVLAGVGVASD